MKPFWEYAEETETRRRLLSLARQGDASAKVLLFALYNVTIYSGKELAALKAPSFSPPKRRRLRIHQHHVRG
jgi:hypothetical protein